MPRTCPRFSKQTLITYSCPLSWFGVGSGSSCWPQKEVWRGWRCAGLIYNYGERVLGRSSFLIIHPWSFQRNIKSRYIATGKDVNNYMVLIKEHELVTNVDNTCFMILNPLWTKFFFRRFFGHDLRYPLFVYRLIGTTLKGNFFDNPFLK